jgi:hypothetical protein
MASIIAEVPEIFQVCIGDQLFPLFVVFLVEIFLFVVEDSILVEVPAIVLFVSTGEASVTDRVAIGDGEFGPTGADHVELTARGVIVGATTEFMSTARVIFTASHC